jgi:NACHT domain-containing protein
MFAIDDVITGVLVNVIAVAGRRLAVAVRTRKYAADLDLARWLDTGHLTQTLPDLASLSEETTSQLAAILRGDEAQAALQELLAARLTDAAELYTTAARATLTRTLASVDPGAGAKLTDFYDDQICTLVARLEVADLPLLTQIRSDAFASRMIAILHAIERHTAALTTRPDEHAEARFLDSYRRHVIDRHGMLEPPDFQRRRRVPIGDIYVPPKIFNYIPSERPVVPAPGTPSVTVWELGGELDRSVLLGDPGGGKTTATNVLMHHFATQPDGRIPFVVTLREFAAKDPPERSVTGHIEHTLETLYQCPAPPGLVDLLLLTARAVVIFDGLDELLESSRRAEVSARVEQFCVEYPLAPVLVTSRVTGYSQASLDDRQFSCYLLGGFERQQVAEYARKWFVLTLGSRPGDADAFIAESESVYDLRSNPLLLSLMCILYRGAGSLPQDRDEIYAKCTDLLIRDWDDYRRIRRELRAGRQVKPALRYLAWWLFTRQDAATAVTERELIARTAEFLRSSFESPDDAQDAAREFVEFCHGRMWIFTDVGTTAAGDKLYAFTHRTFLEYFAAAHLAYDCDTPENLAATLAPHLVHDEWPVVAELAVQIKDRASSNGAARVYAAVLTGADQWTQDELLGLLRFLALTLRSVDPSPQQVRALTGRLIAESIVAEGDLNPVGGLRPADTFMPPTALWQGAVSELLNNCGQYRDTVADELGSAIQVAVATGDQKACVNAIRLAAALSDTIGAPTQVGFWEECSAALLRADPTATIEAAAADPYVRTKALEAGLITLRDALELPGGLRILSRDAGGYFSSFSTPTYLWQEFRALLRGWPPHAPTLTDDLTAIGQYLIRHPELPWFEELAITKYTTILAILTEAPDVPPAGDPAHSSDPRAYLGAAAILMVCAEAADDSVELRDQVRAKCPLAEISQYLGQRAGTYAGPLPDLPLPEESGPMFQAIFRDWANGTVNFLGPS